MSHLTPVPSDPDELRAWLQQLQETAGQPDLLAGFEDNEQVELDDPPDTVRELTIKVTLRGTKPPIWRRLVVAGDTTLDALHEVLQAAMGWTDSHLHRFYPGPDDRGAYFVTDYDQEEGDDGTPEDAVRVDQVLREPGDRFRYDYDFGDGWSHDVRLESVADISGEPLPRCPAGRLACPPEDVGGVGGYEEVAAWHRAGRTEEALPRHFDSLEHAVAWLPIDWDPDDFDPAEVNLGLQARERAERLVERLRPELVDLLGRLDPRGKAVAMEWAAAIKDEPLSKDDLVAATHHWRVLLDAVGGGVKLTSAGYLPPAVVQQVYDALELGELWFGKGNREDHTPPIARLRASAQQLGLLRKAKENLTPTATVRRLATDPGALGRFVLDRLPAGRGDLEKEAGWFALLGLAAGVPERPLHDGIAILLESRGWRLRDGSPPDEWAVRDAVRPTVGALTGPAGALRRLDAPWPPWLRPIAAQAASADH